MDLFFDDRPATNEDGTVQKAVSAGAVADGRRSWLVEAWYAPFSGNHHFQVSGTVRAVTGLGSSSGCSASRPFWSRRAPDGWGGLAASVGSVWGAS